MTTTITGAGETVSTPLAVLGWQATREGRNVVHDLIGGGIAVTMATPRPRSGVLELLYATEADALAAVDMHTYMATCTISDTDRAAVSMTYVLGPMGVTLRLDDETRDAWVVEVDFQEVDA